MLRVDSGVSRGLRGSVLGLGAVGTVLGAATDSADAGRYYRRYYYVRHVTHHSIRDNGYSPAYATIVVDANTGKVLDERNADSQRHPASLTKIMTLYLLFERLDAGKIKLSTMLPVSE